MNDQPAIAARGLIKRFGEVHAVDGIDLDVPRGMIFAILGPNGGATSIDVLMALIAPAVLTVVMAPLKHATARRCRRAFPRTSVSDRPFDARVVCIHGKASQKRAVAVSPFGAKCLFDMTDIGSPRFRASDRKAKTAPSSTDGFGSSRLTARRPDL